MTELEYAALKGRKLMLAVEKSYPHESPYETALRFIKERVEQEKADQKRKTVNRNTPFDWKSVYK